MKTKIYFLIIFCYFTNLFSKQNTFIHNFVNITESNYRNTSFIQLPDSGYIVYSGNELFRLDQYANEIWHKTFAFIAEYSNNRRYIENLNDSLFILRQINNLIVLNHNGAVKWNREFGNDILINSIASLNNNILFSYSIGYSDTMRVMSLDIDQQVLWDKKYFFKYSNSVSYEEGISVISNGFIVHGTADDYGGLERTGNRFLVKFDESGDTLWSKKYIYGSVEQGYCVIEDQDRNLYITGNCCTNSIQKVDSTGNSKWLKNINIFNQISYFHSSADSNIIVCSKDWGETKSFYLSKIDTAGNVIWSKNIPIDSSNIQDLEIYQSRLTLDGGNVILGQKKYGNKDYQVFLLKSDSTGKIDINDTISFGLKESNFCGKNDTLDVYINISGTFPDTDFYIELSLDSGAFKNVIVLDSIQASDSVLVRIPIYDTTSFIENDKYYYIRVTAPGISYTGIPVTIIFRTKPQYDLIKPENSCVNNFLEIQLNPKPGYSIVGDKYRWDLGRDVWYFTSYYNNKTKDQKYYIDSKGLEKFKVTISNYGCSTIIEDSLRIYGGEYSNLIVESLGCDGRMTSVQIFLDTLLLKKGVDSLPDGYKWYFGAARVISGEGFGPYVLGWDQNEYNQMGILFSGIDTNYCSLSNSNDFTVGSYDINDICGITFTPENDVKIRMNTNIISIIESVDIHRINEIKDELIGTVELNSADYFIDTAYVTNMDYAYYVIPFDTCGNKWHKSNQYKPLLLTVQAEDSENILLWKDFYSDLSFNTYAIFRGSAMDNMDAVAVVERQPANQYTDTSIFKEPIFYQLRVFPLNLCNGDPLSGNYLSSNVVRVIPGSFTSGYPVNIKKNYKIQMINNNRYQVMLEDDVDGFDFSLYNLKGQKIIEKGAEGSSFEIDLGEYNSGIYIIKVLSKNQVYISKLIRN